MGVHCKFSRGRQRGIYYYYIFCWDLIRGGGNLTCLPSRVDAHAGKHTTLIYNYGMLWEKLYNSLFTCFMYMCTCVYVYARCTVLALLSRSSLAATLAVVNSFVAFSSSKQRYGGPCWTRFTCSNESAPTIFICFSSSLKSGNYHFERLENKNFFLCFLHQPPLQMFPKNLRDQLIKKVWHKFNK